MVYEQKSINSNSGTDFKYWNIVLNFPPPSGSIWENGAYLMCQYFEQYEEPSILWSRPTQGRGNELSRCDWVKERVRNYAFPNWNSSYDITSSWPTSGWTNTLGNGYMIVMFKVGTNTKNAATLFDGNARVAHWGNSNTEMSCCCPIPVLSGHTYKLYMNNNAGIMNGVGTTGSLTAPDHVYFSYVKY